MAQNLILKGKNNPVEIIFGGVNLTLFTDLSVTFGSDTRTLQLNPESVVVVGASTLRLFFNDTVETKAFNWLIYGVDVLNPDGRAITSDCLNNLPKSYVCEG